MSKPEYPTEDVAGPLLWRVARVIEDDGSTTLYTRYAVSSHGHIRNQTTGKVLEWLPCPSRDNRLIYWRVGLCKAGPDGTALKRRFFFIHRLVGFAFVPGYEVGMEGHHIDGDPAHNWAMNVLWCWHKENCGYIRNPYEGVPPYVEPEDAPF